MAKRKRKGYGSQEDLDGVCKVLRAYFKNQEFPLEADVNDEIWKDPAAISCTNCYRYSMGFIMQEEMEIVMTFLGWSVGNFKHVKGNEAYRLWKKDMKNLGFTAVETKDAESLPKKGSKIALVILEEDFHFLRQNKDGTWSHKDGFNADVEYFEKSPFEFTCDTQKVLEVRVFNVFN